MAWEPAVCLLAVLSAGGCAVAIGLRLADWQARTKARETMLSEDASLKSGIVAAVLRNGVGVFRPLAEVLLFIGSLSKLVDESIEVLADRGYETSAVSLLSALMASALGCGFGAWILTRSVPGGIAVTACVPALFFAWSGNRWNRLIDGMRETVPDVIATIRACFQSGYSLLQTFEALSKEGNRRVRLLFEHGAHVLETGGGTSDALACLKEEHRAPELMFVAVALDVQHKTGGSMGQVLQSAQDMVASELDLARQLRTQTAQARLSAGVVSVMPFAMIAFFSLISSDFLQPFFGSVAGVCLLCLAVGMQVGGIVLVRRILRVEG